MNLFCLKCKRLLSYAPTWITGEYFVRGCTACDEARDAKEAGLCEKIGRLEAELETAKDRWMNAEARL